MRFHFHKFRFHSILLETVILEKILISEICRCGQTRILWKKVNPL